MKTILIVLALALFYSTSFAEQIYTYTDKDGNTVISNTPVPDKYKPKSEKIESYERDSPAAIAAFQQQQRIAEERNFREWQNSQSQSDRRASSQSSNTAYEATKKKTDKTDRLSKEYWDAVDQCRGKRHCNVSKDLSDEYQKAIKDDPRTITTVTTTKRGR